MGPHNHHRNRNHRTQPIPRRINNLLGTSHIPIRLQTIQRNNRHTIHRRQPHELVYNEQQMGIHLYTKHRNHNKPQNHPSPRQPLRINKNTRHHQPCYHPIQIKRNTWIFKTPHRTYHDNIIHLLQQKTVTKQINFSLKYPPVDGNNQ